MHSHCGTCSEKKGEEIPMPVLSSPHSEIPEFVSMFPISAFRTDAVDQCDAAKRTAVDGSGGGVLLRGGVDAAGEGDLRNVELVFQKLIDDFDHSFDRHGLSGDDEACVGIGGGEFGVECRALHFV